MSTHTLVRNVRFAAGVVGSLAGFMGLTCLFAANPALADGSPETVAIHVNAQGLDLTREEGLRKLY